MLTYFVSDVHLGAPAMSNNRERELRFVHLLDEMKQDAKAIYLLGDIFDFWYEYRKVVPRGFVRALAKIAELTDSGIEVHFFTGNHDIWVTDYLPSEIGVIIHREPLLTKIDDKTFFLAHGDGLDKNETGYLWLKRLFTSKLAQFVFSRLHPNFAFWIGHLWAKKSRLAKGTAPEVSKGIDFERNVSFARNYVTQGIPVDYFVFGHRHVMLNEEVAPNTKVVMLGEWFNYFSYAVFDGKSVDLKRYTR